MHNIDPARIIEANTNSNAGIGRALWHTALPNMGRPRNIATVFPSIVFTET